MLLTSKLKREFIYFSFFCLFFIFFFLKFSVFWSEESCSFRLLEYQLQFCGHVKFNINLIKNFNRVVPRRRNTRIGWKVHRLTKILRYNVTSWGYFSTCSSLAFLIFLPSVLQWLDLIFQKSHQLQIRRHRMNFSANELFNVELFSLWLFRTMNFSADELFSQWTFQPKNISAYDFFALWNFQPMNFSDNELFTLWTFQPKNFSTYDFFTQGTFQPMNFSV